MPKIWDTTKDFLAIPPKEETGEQAMLDTVRYIGVAIQSAQDTLDHLLYMSKALDRRLDDMRYKRVTQFIADTQAASQREPNPMLDPQLG